MKTYYLTNPNQRGSDLKDLQTALKKAKFYHGPVDGVFGGGTGNACVTAKFHFGYPMRAVKPSGGQTLLNYLRGTTKLPPDYIKRRQARGFGLDLHEQQRKLIVGYALWGVEHEPEIHYAQVRPMDHLFSPKKLPWWADCSEFVTTIYKWAGAPDPNGRNYDGLGWTGTMLGNGRWIPVWQAKPGDVVIWGSAPGHHTAVIVDTKSLVNPMTVSHGSEGGPLKVSLLSETAAQSGRPFQIRRYILD